MLITEMVTINGNEFRHNYSDEGYYIRRNDGKKFADALDIIEAEWTYTESDEKIPEPEPLPEEIEVLINAE